MLNDTQDPEIIPDGEGEDAVENDGGVFESEAFGLFAKLMESSMSQTQNITTSLIESYREQAEDRGKALENLLELLYELRFEVPRSSRGGELVALAEQIVVYGLYSSYRDGKFKPQYYPPYQGE